jgi:alpha-galactosidase
MTFKRLLNQKLNLVVISFFAVLCYHSKAQAIAETPPMGWMTWNLFWDNINEKDILEIADKMVETGMSKKGYQYIFIDDGWQGGRDNANNMIPDPLKFPHGIKWLADQLHAKGLKIGIYSNAAQLTCGNYTASYNFEKQDAETFAYWGIDYLKYDYCHAPADSATAKIRYKAMADALKNSGRPIMLGICEWGVRKPWLWAAKAGGSLWRTTGDIRDKWKNVSVEKNLQKAGYGILDIIDENAPLHSYASKNAWNDCDMLIVGLYGAKGPTSLKNGIGCNDTEYQTQMSMWCMMASPIIATNDLRKMNKKTLEILTNEQIIAINQDKAAKQAIRKVHNNNYDVFVKPLQNNKVAIAILNRLDRAQDITVNLETLGLSGKFNTLNVWKNTQETISKVKKTSLLAHETEVIIITETK